MKQFILLRSEAGLSLGVLHEDGYMFHDGFLSVTEVLSGEYGTEMELLGLEEMQERINGADYNIDGGF